MPLVKPEDMSTRDWLLYRARQENEADRRYLEAYEAECDRWVRFLQKWSYRIIAATVIWGVIWMATL